MSTRQQQQKQQYPRKSSSLPSLAKDKPVLEGIDGEKLYYEDDEWTPSLPMLLMLGMILMLVAGGVGVGIWQVIEKNNRDNDSTTKGPTFEPTSSPTITSSPTTESQKFICNICGSSIDNAVLNNPGTAVTITVPGSSTTTTNTCEEWFDLGLRGGISRDDCVLFLPNVIAPCGCVAAPTEPPTISPSPTVLVTRSPSFFQCNVCGDSEGNQSIEDPIGIIPNIPGIGDVSCQQIEQIAASGLIPESLCIDDLFNAVNTNCGCTFQCRLCLSGQTQEVLNPDDVVNLPLGQPSQTCQQLLESTLAQPPNQQQCTIIRQSFEDVCQCVGSDNGGGDAENGGDGDGEDLTV
jgi:hypothetical protein